MNRVVLAIAIATVVLAIVILSLPSSPIADEQVHFAQAQSFASGRWEISPQLSTWPTMNFIVAVPMGALGINSLTLARAAIASSALLAVIGFYLLAAHFDQFSAGMKTAQLFTLPIVLPYCGLVYTDIPALAAIIWMTFAACKQRFTVFALAGILAIALRQNNIVWFAAGVLLYVYVLTRGGATPFSRKMLPLAVLCIVVGAVWALIVWNQGGISLTATTQEAHSFRLRGLPNVEFAVALGGVLFLPVLFSAKSRFVEAMQSTRWALVFLGVLLCVGLTFLVRHPYNASPGIIDGFLRNRLLFAVDHTSMRWLFAALVAASAFAFCIVQFCPAAARFKVPLYTFGACSVLPFQLIEQRYYLPVFALFWAFRAPVSKGLERTQLAWNVCLTIAALAAIRELNVFL